MSFGFSIGDIIKLVELTASAYSKWKNACGSYTSITRDLSVLQTILQRIEGEAKLPDSLFSRHPEDFKGWRSLVTSCEDVVTELADIVGKYKSLGSGKQKTWDRIRMANQDINAIHSRLVKATTSLNALVAVTGIGSLGRIEGSQQRVEGSFDRVENEVLPELLQKMDKLAEQMRKGNATSVTALTTYSDDDKSIWKEFRRDLINAGIRSRDIHRHSPALRTYLARLQREGLLDETEPQPLDNVPESSDIQASLESPPADSQLDHNDTLSPEEKPSQTANNDEIEQRRLRQTLGDVPSNSTQRAISESQQENETVPVSTRDKTNKVVAAEELRQEVFHYTEKISDREAPSYPELKQGRLYRERQFSHPLVLAGEGNSKRRRPFTARAEKKFVRDKASKSKSVNQQMRNENHRLQRGFLDAARVQEERSKRERDEQFSRREARSSSSKEREHRERSHRHREKDEKERRWRTLVEKEREVEERRKLREARRAEEEVKDLGAQKIEDWQDASPSASEESNRPRRYRCQRPRQLPSEMCLKSEPENSIVSAKASPSPKESPRTKDDENEERGEASRTSDTRNQNVCDRQPFSIPLEEQDEETVQKAWENYQRRSTPSELIESACVFISNEQGDIVTLDQYYEHLEMINQRYLGAGQARADREDLDNDIEVLRRVNERWPNDVYKRIIRKYDIEGPDAYYEFVKMAEKQYRDDEIEKMFQRAEIGGSEAKEVGGKSKETKAEMKEVQAAEKKLPVHSKQYPQKTKYNNGFLGMVNEALEAGKEPVPPPKRHSSKKSKKSKEIDALIYGVSRLV